MINHLRIFSKSFFVHISCHQCSPRNFSKPQIQPYRWRLQTAPGFFSWKKTRACPFFCCGKVFYYLPKTNSKFAPEKWWERETIVSFSERAIFSGNLLVSGRGTQIFPRLWFQIFFIFTPTWGNDPI